MSCFVLIRYFPHSLTYAVDCERQLHLTQNESASAINSRISRSSSRAVPYSWSCPESLQYSWQKKLGKILESDQGYGYGRRKVGNSGKDMFTTLGNIICMSLIILFIDGSENLN